MMQCLKTMRSCILVVVIITLSFTCCFGQELHRGGDNGRVESCHDYRGYDVDIGDTYRPSRDSPCITCLCRLQYRPPGDVAGCSTVQCARPPCDNYTVITGECCGYKCPDIDADAPQPIVNDNEDSGTPWCRDFRGFTVSIGERYNPSYNEPCIDCECESEPRDPGDFARCATPMCRSPPNCRDFQKIPGECCGFICLDDDNDSDDDDDDDEGYYDVNHGNLYNDNINDDIENVVPIIPPVHVPIQPQHYPVVGSPLRSPGLSFGFGDLLAPCCEAGQEWYDDSREQCPAYTGEVASGTEEEKQRCRHIIDICCIQEMETRECERGISTARIQGNCQGFQRQSDREDATECCTCCLLGLDASSIGVSCSVLNSGNFTSRCQASFTECCDGAVYRPAITTDLPTTTTTIHPDDNLHLCRQFQGQLCAHICRDVPGSYKCACREGFELHSDGRTCTQQTHQNRCDINNPCDHLCIDTGTAVNCKCFDGFRLTNDGFTCDDINECDEGTHNCYGRQSCANSDGSFTCLGPVDGELPPVTPIPRNCEVGYAYNSVTQECEDIDECIINRFTCESTEECINNEGSFVCQSNTPELNCGRGFYFNRETSSCDDLDECELGTHRCTELNQKCKNSVGSFECSCDTGFIYNRRTGQCEDVNECALSRDTCMFGQSCVNNIGSYSCRRTVSCGTGYILNMDGINCEDIDECTLNTHDCGPSKECHNIPGSFRCTAINCPLGYSLNVNTGRCDPLNCQPGYQPNSQGNCIDTNECNEAVSPCRPNQACRNTVGSFTCRNLLQCGPGFELNEEGSRCIDINECLRGTHDCIGRMVRCVNRRGTYICQCPDGFQMDGQTRRCKDIDECNSPFGGNVCDLNAKCENSEGSFRCVCNEGFQNEGSFCRDFNECDRPGMCQHTCRNTRGSFQCSCFEGYQLSSDSRSCEDVDECAVYEERGGRLCLGTCTNTQGSYRCDCPEGYRMDDDGRTCQDIDECAERSADCYADNEQCINTRGGYKCETVQCPKGFIKAPSANNRNNAIRCQRQTFVCPQGDTECLYAPLSLSYNFITFPEKIRIPADLFTMRGPQSHHRRLEFELDLESASDPITGESRVDISFFKLISTGDSESMVRLVKEIDGPQDINLKLNMNIYSREFRDDQEEIFFGTAIAVIYVYVTDDF